MIVPEIWSATDRLFLILDHFLPFYPINDPENQNFNKMKKITEDIIIFNKWIINYNHMMYSSWDMKRATDIIFCHFGPFFALYPTNNPKNQDVEKMKKTRGDIILHNCTKNHDHMLYCSWDMARNGCNLYISFWAIFYPFTP